MPLMAHKNSLSHVDGAELGDYEEAGTHSFIIRPVPCQPTDRLKKKIKKSNDGQRTSDGSVRCCPEHIPVS